MSQFGLIQLSISTSRWYYKKCHFPSSSSEECLPIFFTPATLFFRNSRLKKNRIPWVKTFQECTSFVQVQKNKVKKKQNKMQGNKKKNKKSESERH